MKKIMIFMLVIVAGMTACKKDQTTSTQSTSSVSLPLMATAYIDSNYPDASIDYVVVLKNSNARYIVTLNTAEELAFTQNGDFLGDGLNFNGGPPDGNTICGDTTHEVTVIMEEVITAAPDMGPRLIPCL
ncbi:MAG: hypothetical protein NTW10_14710 [Bacteroidetes bacterium]|nr:hypothetical protein [Bacteroidota bacterium]